MVAIQSGRMPFLFGALISSRLKNRENERNEANVCSGGSVFFTGSHLQYAVIWTVSKMMPFTFLSTSLDTPPPPTPPPLLLPSPPPFRQTKIPFFFCFYYFFFLFPWGRMTGINRIVPLTASHVHLVPSCNTHVRCATSISAWKKSIKNSTVSPLNRAGTINGRN